MHNSSLCLFVLQHRLDRSCDVTLGKIRLNFGCKNIILHTVNTSKLACMMTVVTVLIYSYVLNTVVTRLVL